MIAAGARAFVVLHLSPALLYYFFFLSSICDVQEIPGMICVRPVYPPPDASAPGVPLIYSQNEVQGMFLDLLSFCVTNKIRTIFNFFQTNCRSCGCSPLSPLLLFVFMPSLKINTKVWALRVRDFAFSKPTTSLVSRSVQGFPETFACEEEFVFAAFDELHDQKWPLTDPSLTGHVEYLHLCLKWVLLYLLAS